MRLNKLVRIEDLFACHVPYLRDLFQSSVYPWELLPKIKAHIQSLFESGMDGFRRLSEDVLVGDGVEIASTATIIGPTILGHGTQVRPGAYIRGCVITGENGVIGNSSEIKNAILLDKVQIPHYNYIGDSILGNHVHMGAGAICSNLKADGKPVVIHADLEYDTGLRKIGGILGDGADVGCGCVLNPGTVIGRDTTVYPLVSLRGVISGGCIVKAADTIVRRRV